MRMDIAAQTDIGRRKKNNEDSYGVYREDTPGLQLFTEGAMLAVADGLGGHAHGEIASKLAVSFTKEILSSPAPPPPEDPEAPDRGALPLMEEAVRKANQNIQQQNVDFGTTDKPMGTTLVSALITPRKVYICNVGDSRCYHFRDGEIIEKTEDHSWVDEQVKQGKMTRAEAEVDHRRNFVTRSLGTHPDVEPDTYVWHVVPGDWLLLCSDGLVNMVKDAEITEQFRKGGSAAEIASRLVEMANENGGKDNITVIAANVSPDPFRLLMLRTRSYFRRHGGAMRWIAGLVSYAALWFAAGYLTRAFDLVRALRDALGR